MGWRRRGKWGLSLQPLWAPQDLMRISAVTLTLELKETENVFWTTHRTQEESEQKFLGSVDVIDVYWGWRVGFHSCPGEWPLMHFPGESSQSPSLASGQNGISLTHGVLEDSVRELPAMHIHSQHSCWEMFLGRYQLWLPAVRLPWLPVNPKFVQLEYLREREELPALRSPNIT